MVSPSGTILLLSLITVKPVQKNINNIDSNLNKWIISDEINLKYNSRTFLKEDTESFIHSVWYNVENEDVLGKHPEYFFHGIKYEKTLSDSLRYVYHTNEWVGNR